MSGHSAQRPQPGPIDLVRIDAEAGRFRAYRLFLQPDLFGGCSLVREWGRIGRPGTVRVRTLATEAEAATALARALVRRHRRGYRPRSNRRRADDDAAAPAAAER
ncbi:MAG: WGR domain-containing protein [Alphaproteobacteria bacterium]|jgi:predicted DNA-binding WGR domain protein|nr:WGR domain-containing protein [Alphaproteobacteria bacterium]